MNNGAFVLLLGLMAAGSIGVNTGGTVDDDTCRCNIHGDLLEVTDCGDNFPKQANISVEFSDDAHSGECDGNLPPCPVVGDCSGSVKVTAASNAFTVFGAPPGQPAIPLAGTVTETFAVGFCGDHQKKWYSIIHNITGVSLCIVEFAGWCDACGGT